jgi:Tfp pilus assembly protein PilN
MINLLPPDTKDNLRFARLNVTMVEYSALILITALGLIGILFFGQSLASREERLLSDLTEDKRANLSEYDDQLAEAKALDNRIDTIAALLEREIAFSELLPAIGSLVPSGTTINGLELDSEDGNSLIINGESASQTGPSVFRQNLANTDSLFSRADIVSINLIANENGPDVYNFQIDAQFAEGAKQELEQ